MSYSNSNEYEDLHDQLLYAMYFTVGFLNNAA